MGLSGYSWGRSLCRIHRSRVYLGRVRERGRREDPTQGETSGRYNHRRFQNGQLVGSHRYSLRELLLRWLRRNRAVVAISAIALIALASLGIVGIDRIREQRTIAQQERDEAKRHRAETQELMDFMLFDLREAFSV